MKRNTKNNIIYHTWEILVGKKLANLANCEPFAKIFLTNIHRYTETYMAYALTVAYSPNFFLPIPITYMIHQNFPLPNISRVRYEEMDLYTAVTLGKLLSYVYCKPKLKLKYRVRTCNVWLYNHWYYFNTNDGKWNFNSRILLHSYIFTHKLVNYSLKHK